MTGIMILPAEITGDEEEGGSLSNNCALIYAIVTTFIISILSFIMIGLHYRSEIQWLCHGSCIN